MPTEPLPNLVLTGFMGVGKTTIGRLAAHKLDLLFIDTDAEVARIAKMSIPDIFAHYGEASFRDLEARVCRYFASKHGHVIATGGGALLNPDTLATMSATGVVVCLSAPESLLRRRLGGESGRPLANNWLARLHERQPAYDAMPHQVSTAGKSPNKTTEEVIALWRKFST
jgi:shikimate kinase